jgi:hypothetical protein
MRCSVMVLLVLLTYSVSFAQDDFKGKKFEQMGTMLPTPNSYRAASGAPGHEYWQQKADYLMEIEVNDEDQTLHGYEEITYTNNAPEPLTYFWLQ